MINVDICNKALRSIHVATIISEEDNSPQAVDCNLYYEHCLKELLTSYDWNFALVTLYLHDGLNIAERHQQRLEAIENWNIEHMSEEGEPLEGYISEELIAELEDHYVRESHEYNFMYDMPEDLIKVVDIRHEGRSLYRTAERPDFEIGNSRFYGTDPMLEGSYNFDERWPQLLVNGELFKDREPRTVIKSKYSGLTLQYVAYITDVNLYPSTFVEVLKLKLALALTISYNNDKMLFQGLLSLYNQALERAKIYDCRQVSISYL